MNARTTSLMTAGGFLAFTFIFLGIALTYPPEARLFPVIVLTSMAVLGIIQLWFELRKKPTTVVERTAAETLPKEDPISEGRMILYTCLAVPILWIFGLITGLSVYLLLYFGFVSRLPLKKNLMITAGTAIFYYILFVKVLQIFYRGVLGIFV
jgi:hypothetical protein